MILLEGVRAVALPCTLALLVPGVVVVLAGRLRWLVVVGVVAAAWLTIWSGSAGMLPVTPPASLGPRLVVAGVLAAAVVVVWWRRRWWSDLIGGAAAGLVAALLWVPCVGRELGAAISTAPTDPWGQLLPLAAYTLGALLPLVVLGAIGALVDQHLRMARVGAAGTIAGGLLAVTIASGAWSTAVGALVRATL